MEAYREWRVRCERDTVRPILQSMSYNHLWPDGELTADRVPVLGETLGNAHGVHAALADSTSSYLTKLTTRRSQPLLLAIGRVEAWGTIVGHEDGVIRAEHMRVLALRLLLLPPAEACACGRLVVVDGHPLEPPVYRLRTPCEPGRCGTRRLGYWSASTRIAETTLVAVESSLVQRYEIERLPEHVGPWQWPQEKPS